MSKKLDTDLKSHMRFFKQKGVWKKAGQKPSIIKSIDQKKKYLKLIKQLTKLGSKIRIVDGEHLVNSDLPLDQGYTIDTFMIDKLGNLVIVGER
tara:strand:- start:1191 stop:1472 length:282 start_codon:yes stop_codon:yes gene_type:complete